MKIPTILLFILAKCISSYGQITVSSIDTLDQDVKDAIQFYKQYVNEFTWEHSPDYSKYWSAEDCKRYKVPDHTIFSISSDVPTFLFTEQQTIYYTQKHKDYVHIKTLLTQLDSLKQITVLAITNHYVARQPNSGKLYFISPFKINADKFKTVVNRNITYHFPVEYTFNKQKSDSLLIAVEKMEKLWGFKPISLDYYFAETKDKVAMIRGLDYYLGMEEPAPTGYAFDYNKIVFSSGVGEAHFHEILHIYFNPVYGKSPFNHGLIYYLAGGLGHNFNWMIHRMNDYLQTHPTTDLSQFEKVYTNDRLLHVENTILGLICKIIDEKEGQPGLKRLLSYATVDELFEKEFQLQRKDYTAFLRQNFKKYDQ